MFFLRVFSEEDFVCYFCWARYCMGQEPDGTETLLKKTAFRRVGPNSAVPFGVGVQNLPGQAFARRYSSTPGDIGPTAHLGN